MGISRGGSPAQGLRRVLARCTATLASATAAAEKTIANVRDALDAYDGDLEAVFRLERALASLEAVRDRLSGGGAGSTR